NLTGPCRATSLGPVCRHHHRKPAPHKPPGPTRGSFTATGKATATQNETEHSHWVPLAAATTALAPPHLPDPHHELVRNLPGPCRSTSLGPVCRHHHCNPAPHKPLGPTRGSFTATGKATGTQNEPEHSHWVRLAAAITAPTPHTGASGPDLPDPRGGVIRSARAAKCARLPLPVARDERAGVEVAVWVRGAQQAHHEVHPRRREVLLHPRGVVGAHPVVVRERAAGVDERLLDRGLHHVVRSEEH